MNRAYEKIEINRGVVGSQRLTRRKNDDVSFPVERWTDAGYPPFLAAAAHPRECSCLAVEDVDVGEQVLVARDLGAVTARSVNLVVWKRRRSSGSPRPCDDVRSVPEEFERGRSVETIRGHLDAAVGLDLDEDPVFG
jgi:hypothetical protein